jgi:phosphate transport system substrate-binding protein
MRAAAVGILLSISVSGYAQSSSRYEPTVQVSGTIRSWGSVQMGELMRLWEHGFHQYHPAVRFEDKLSGTVSGMGGLYSGVIDLSLMGREIWPTEAMAYEQVTGRAPDGVQVAIGSFDVPTKADALAVFVHRKNPLRALNLDQLRSVFGCDDVGSKCVQSWRTLGLSGEWANKPIHLYGYKLDNAAAIFFRNVVLKDSEWRCGIKTFANQVGSKGRRIDSGQLIVDALKRDPGGIAISNPYYAGAEVRALAVSVDGGSQIYPTKGEVASGRYPLARAVYIFFNREKDQTISPRIREFLRYILSREGQQEVVREGAYLPLPEDVRRKQLARIP